MQRYKPLFESRWYDPERPTHLNGAALDYFGETENPWATGYIQNDGTMLDLSAGQKERVQDHREVNSAFLDFKKDDVEDIEGYGVDRDSNSFWMIHYQIVANAIRMGVYRDNVSFDMKVKPSYAQKKKMREIVEEVYPSEIIVDYKNKSYQFEPDDFIYFLERI